MEKHCKWVIDLEFKLFESDSTTASESQDVNDIQFGRILERDAIVMVNNQEYRFDNLWLQPDYANLADELINCGLQMGTQLCRLMADLFLKELKG
jgi:hypothetical protein